MKKNPNGKVKKMIVFSQATHNARMDQTKECIKRVNKYGTFDRRVIVVSESPLDTLTEENKQWLLDNGCEVYTREWDDDMPGMRNAYLDKCHVGDWIVVSDSDEWFCDALCRDIRDIINKTAEPRGLNLLLINSHDITYQKDGSGDEVTSDFFKNLIFKKDESTRYEGVGQEKKVHETLILKENNVAQLDRRYYYIHVKYWHEVWERATRNVFIGGGGNNEGENNPEWVKLRKLTKEMGIDTWPKFREYLMNSEFQSVNGIKLMGWIIHNRRMGYDWENEMCDVFRWFRYLHPDIVPEDVDVITEISDKRKKIMAEVEQAYLDVLGRHADTPGKMLYTRMIEQGRMTINLVKEALMNSPERRGKFPSGEETIRAEKVKIDVDIHLTDEIITNLIINKSKIYKEKYYKPLRLGQKCNALLAMARKEETEGRGTDESSPNTFMPFIDTFHKLCPPKDFNTILDIGAGDGSETHLLQQCGYNVMGITFGIDNIDLAKDKYDIELLEMDMHDLSFPDNFFDATFSIQTFEHSFAPWLHILEMRRVLRDGGRVFINVPDPDNQEMLETIWHTNVLYPNQIRALFNKAGFQEVKGLTKKHHMTFCFEKIPDDEFIMWGYVKHIMEKLRRV